MSSFLRLAKLLFAIDVEDFTEKIGESTELESILGGCRIEVHTALAHLDRYGVSVALVYRLEVLEESLDRFELLIEALTSSDGSRWKVLIADLIRSRFAGSSLRSLVQENLHLLARKIVERTGVSGEHYIARSAMEYLSMLRSAAGGGILTVGTTLTKFLIGAAQAPLFFEGLLSWINYAGSFLLMQSLHFTLATKQPSMTAPALAAKLRRLTTQAQIMEFVEEVAMLTRSQFAAALGNLGLVVPCAILFDLAWTYSFGEHVLSSAYALKTIASLNPLTSLTIPLAALTGVLLWLSSIAAGWTENWIVYRRIPEAVAQNRYLNRLFGTDACAKLAQSLSRNISGIGGNISLGGLLAFTPIAGRFFGLPIDVRHVTLSAGALTFAVCALEPSDVRAADIFFAVVGIAIIGLLNFGVSFALALYTAFRARKINSAWFGPLRSYLGAKIRYQPLDFFLPPRKQTPLNLK